MRDSRDRWSQCCAKAAPYMSALTATVAISRLIAVVSGCECPRNEVGILSFVAGRKIAPLTKVEGYGIRHAGRPTLKTSLPRSVGPPAGTLRPSDIC